MMKLDLSKKLEVKIGRKWYRCLGINFEMGTFSWYQPNAGKWWALGIGEGITSSRNSGWPLSSAKGFRNEA